MRKIFFVIWIVTLTFCLPAYCESQVSQETTITGNVIFPEYIHGQIRVLALTGQIKPDLTPENIITYTDIPRPGPYTLKITSNKIEKIYIYAYNDSKNDGLGYEKSDKRTIFNPPQRGLLMLKKGKKIYTYIDIYFPDSNRPF